MMLALLFKERRQNRKIPADAGNQARQLGGESRRVKPAGQANADKKTPYMCDHT